MPTGDTGGQTGIGAMKTFNKRGDEGETSLLYGVRVPKSDLRCEAYGTLDEVSSALGLARQWASPEVKEIILSIQQDLFTLGGELATPETHYERLPREKRLHPQATDRLERLIEAYEERIEMPDSFILPGGSPAGAALDLARTITRRAERAVVRLKQEGKLNNPEILRYLNRLADLLYTLARYEEADK